MKVTKKLRIYQLLGIDEEDNFKKRYDNIIEYGKKIYYKIKNTEYPWMPTESSIIEDIVSDSLLIAAENFNDDLKMKFESFFFQKIRGEMYKWSSKKKTEKKYLEKTAEQEGNVFKLFTEGALRIELTTDESKDILQQLEKEDEVKRKITANNIALGDLPFDHQIILKLITEENSFANIADLLGISVDEIKTRKDLALSLLLKKVMRSKHLNDQEKQEVKELYGLQ